MHYDYRKPPKEPCKPNRCYLKKYFYLILFVRSHLFNIKGQAIVFRRRTMESLQKLLKDIDHTYLHTSIFNDFDKKLMGKKYNNILFLVKYDSKILNILSLIDSNSFITKISWDQTCCPPPPPKKHCDNYRDNTVLELCKRILKLLWLHKFVKRSLLQKIAVLNKLFGDRGLHELLGKKVIISDISLINLYKIKCKLFNRDLVQLLLDGPAELMTIDLQLSGYPLHLFPQLQVGDICILYDDKYLVKIDCDYHIKHHLIPPPMKDELEE